MIIPSISEAILFLISLERVCSITSEIIYTSQNRKVYYIESEYKYDWFESLIKCARLNMSLLPIDSKNKAEDINKLVTTSFGKNCIPWVGGYAVGIIRQLDWVATGEEFTHAFWHIGNSDLYYSEEFCLQIGFMSPCGGTIITVQKNWFHL